jgi:NTE family protein
MFFGRKKKVGLALGGGAARGWAHLGVLQALKEKGIEVDYVAGTSIGALVGGFFAAGNLDQLMAIALNLDWKQVVYYFFEISFPKDGLVDGKKIVQLFRQHVKKTDITSLQIPFRAVATDVMTGQEIVLKEGDVIDAIRASMAIPGIFTPVRRKGQMLVDGGLVNPVPVNVVREMGANVVIAVDLNYRFPTDGKTKKPQTITPMEIKVESFPIVESLNEKIKKNGFKIIKAAQEWLTREKPGTINIFDVLGNSILIAEAQITQARLKTEPPDHLIRPELGHINYMEFFRAREAMELGYRAAMEQLKI